MKERVELYGMRVEPSDEQLFREYWNYDTRKMKEIYDRFNRLRDKVSRALKGATLADGQRERLEKIEKQAQTRCRVLTLAIGARTQDNHIKPPTQFIRPEPLGIYFVGPK